MSHIELTPGIFHSDHQPTVRKIVADPYHKIAQLNRWSVSVNKGKDYQFVFCVCKPGKSQVLWTKFDTQNPEKCEEIADMICKVLDINHKTDMMWHCHNWIKRWNWYGNSFDEFIQKNYKFIDHWLMKL